MLMRAALLIGMASVAVSAPAYAAETIDVPFTTPSTSTTQSYSGLVHVVVSGAGNAAGARLNDAFYFVPNEVHGDGYYQLGFSTTPLGTYDNANAIVNTLGARPAYSLTNTYDFDLQVGATLTPLYFGVTDQNFSDNSGAFTITLNEAAMGAVPEPATWAMMMLGFGMIGFGLRRRSRQVVRVTYA